MAKRYTHTCWVLAGLLGLLVLASIITAVVEFVMITRYDEIPPSGTVAATLPLASYGFGPDKYLIVVDLTVEGFSDTTAPIGTAERIPPKEKGRAKMTIWKHGKKVDDETYDIGIEIKGATRSKQNYGLKLKERKFEDDGSVDWDDLEATLPDFTFGEEKYVLRGGFYEPTLIRDEAAARINSHHQTMATLVELVFVTTDGKTYEGVYLFMTDFTRRSLKAIARPPWPDDSDGKFVKSKNCGKNSPRDIVDGTLILMEYTVQPRKDVEDCGVLPTVDYVKMDYPKCEKYNDLSADIGDYPLCKPVYDEYEKDAHTFRTLPDDPTADTIKQLVNMQSFVSIFLAQQLLFNGDFPYASIFLHVPPIDKEKNVDKEDTRKMNAGPLYDFDNPFWRSYQGIDERKSSFEFVYRASQITPGDPMPLWVALFADTSFHQELHKHAPIFEVQASFAIEVCTKCAAQVEQGYFVRNNERWNPFGSQPVPATRVLEYWTAPEDTHTKSSMEAEVKFVRQWFANRAQNIRDLLASPTIDIAQTDEYVVSHLIVQRATPLIVLLSVTIAYAIALVVAVHGVHTPFLVVTGEEGEHTNDGKADYGYDGVPTSVETGTVGVFPRLLLSKRMRRDR